MVGSLLETVFITNIQFSSRKHSVVPHWLSVLMLQYLAVIVCLPPKKPNSRVTVFINPSTGCIIYLLLLLIILIFHFDLFLPHRPASFEVLLRFVIPHGHEICFTI